MTDILKNTAERLIEGKELSREDFLLLIENKSDELFELLKKHAVEKRTQIYGRSVYIRGLIEVSNICKNDCLYCGIRASNKECQRYRLTDEDILAACKEGYSLGFRTFVLQGGEDPHFTDERLISLIDGIKRDCPDAAITLSLGERERESYARLRAAGADRYLLRHESATGSHYEKLHPKVMSFENRMRCLSDLRELGFQVGAGFMVGSPYQTARELAEDLYFIQSFKPDMCGIGPFIPAANTPFESFPAGSAELTLYLLSIIRLIHPAVLLPATTALGSITEGGREMGILAGANVVMPNLSPESVRKKYAIYDGKLSDGSEAAEGLEKLKQSMKKIGYTVVTDRGDVKRDAAECKQN